MTGRLADGADTAQQMLDLPSELRNVSRRPTPVDECANLTASTGPRRLFPCNGGSVTVACQFGMPSVAP